MTSSSSSTAEQPLCRIFSLADIRSATRDFSEAHVIGKGGFGKVYKALIIDDDGSSTVAIKRLASNSNQGGREFAMEMETLTKVRHRNLVSLIGYCREEGEMILVYEYMPNGTLSDHLESLSWNQRLQICIGAGRGLDYLHTGCSIIHRDVKSTNILLDENFRAKVSDFGLAKHLGVDELQSYVSASVKGSFGYFDPSYFTTGRLTRASDTYAFGVVLLEALSGRSALDKRIADDEGDYLCMSIWAQEKIRNGKADHIIAAGLRGEILDNCLKTFVGVATRCLHYEPKKRITMTRAVAQLELAFEQQERRGTATSRFQFRPFKSRAVASGSTQKDEPKPEATHFPATENKKTSADTQPRALRKDHSVDELPIYVPTFDMTRQRALRVDDHTVDELQSTYIPAFPLAELEDIARPRTWLVNHFVDDLLIYVPAIPLAELEDITHSFSHEYLIAKGSGGELIFRGVLKNGQDVAIKQFFEKSEECERSFIEQVSRESRLKHENLVQILGYCTDGRMRALVYEFAPRGSLHAILHESEPVVPALSWAQRIKIATGVVRGLCYIHDNKLIHRGITCSNVLLFDNEIVKISHPHPSIPCSCERYVTSPGYSPRPTFHDAECPWGTQSSKGNVYCFGLVLLELLTGRYKMDGGSTELFDSNGELIDSTRKLQQDFVLWAKVRLFQDKVHEIVDARIKADYPLEPVKKMAAIAKLCLHYDRYSRPDMSTVSQALEIALQETQEYYLHKP